MATPLVPLINGYRYSWASIEAKIRGKILTGLTEITYQNSVERERVRGQGRHGQGWTAGELDSEASITLSKEDYDALLDELAPDKEGAFDVLFEIVVSYEENGRVTTDTLLDCRIKSGERSHSRGNEGLVVTVPLDVDEILENGHRVIARR